MAFANIGLTPDRGVSYLLPRVVGLRRALDFTLNRRALTADEAPDGAWSTRSPTIKLRRRFTWLARSRTGPLSLSAKRVACCERPMT